MKTRPLTLAAATALAALISFAPGAEAQKRQQRSEQSGAAEATDRIFPNQMAAILRNRGHRAEVVTENNRTRLRTQIGSRRVTVYFYACNDNGCQSIQYRALFERNERFTLAFVNAWNYEKRFAKTYLDSDGDLVLEWDVDFDGGVTAGFISESVATFQTMLNAFDRFTPRDQGAGGGAPSGRSPGTGDGAGRSTTPGSGGGSPIQDGGGRSATPGVPPAERGQAPGGGGRDSGQAAPPAEPGAGGTGGKPNTEDRPGERRT